MAVEVERKEEWRERSESIPKCVFKTIGKRDSPEKVSGISTSLNNGIYQKIINKIIQCAPPE